jgi:DNA-3-methyladenine glycosylase I
MTYCDYCQSAGAHPVHKVYHDTQYGFPLTDDNELFERLILEINQAGLSWETILKKQESFRRAYDNFHIPTVAAYTDDDVQRLLADAGIIRNRLKVHAAITNAQKILALQREYGSFKSWLDAHHPQTKADWVKLFKKTFRFTGGEIVNEFLMSTGYLPGAHTEDCPVFPVVLKANPPWLHADNAPNQ